MQLFYIPQCSIQNRNVHISVLSGALWDMEHVHSAICEIGLFIWKLGTKHVFMGARFPNELQRLNYMTVPG